MEDFNYEMTDGSWTHLEFESKSIRAGTLRRFRAYEAVTSEQYGVDVTTCVICTSDVRKLKHSLVTGINTYRGKGHTHERPGCGPDDSEAGTETGEGETETLRSSGSPADAPDVRPDAAAGADYQRHPASEKRT